MLVDLYGAGKRPLIIAGGIMEDRWRNHGGGK